MKNLWNGYRYWFYMIGWAALAGISLGLFMQRAYIILLESVNYILGSGVNTREDSWQMLMLFGAMFAINTCIALYYVFRAAAQDHDDMVNRNTLGRIIG